MQRVFHDEGYSGADKRLSNLEKNLTMYKGLTFEGEDEEAASFLETIPFSDMAIIMNNNSSKIQKMTAVKVMQRYFRNI